MVTNQQILVALRAGNVVSYRGRLLKADGSDAPSDAQILADVVGQTATAPPHEGLSPQNAPTSMPMLFTGTYQDRRRGVQGKGRTQSTTTAAVAVGATQLSLASIAGLQPGQQLYSLSTAESLFVSNQWNGANPVQLAVPVQVGIANAATIYWSSAAPLGPGLNIFIPDGIGADALVLYDQASGFYRIAASPTGDGLQGTNVQSAAEIAFNGASWDRLRAPSVFKNIAAVAVTAGTPVSIWTPGGGKKFRLMGWALSLAVAGGVIFKDGTTGPGATEVVRTPSNPAGQANVAPWVANGWLSAAANNQLWIDVTASGAVSGFVYGTEE